MENNIIEWAKRFASAGYHVFPLYNSSKGLMKPFGWARNKDPKYPDGRQVEPIKIVAATNNSVEIDEWIPRLKAGYKSTIGGYGIMGIDCVLVDLDVKNGKDGYKEFKEIADKYKIPAPVVVVKTKSGGFHLYFRKPKKLDNVEIKTLAGLTIAGRKYAGVDIRGNGGMILGPLSEGAQESWRAGEYKLIKGQPGDRLSEFPEEIIRSISKTTIANDLENMVESYQGGDEDVISVLRRGEIPKSLPDGQRNEGFYAFINALKNKGIPKESARVLCESLALSCGDPESLKASVNIEDMLLRIYSVNQDNPYDIALDLIDHGLYQLMSYKTKINYVIFSDNPYLVSRSPHDETSLRTLMARYVRKVDQPGGKPKSVNPVDVIIKALPDTNKVDSIGFKPGAGDVYSNSEDIRARRFLNTYNPPFVPGSSAGLDDTIFDEFRFVVSRIFGDFGTQEFQLGMDFSAWVIQRPGIKPAICPYVMSKNRGVGKSLYISTMSQMAGTNKAGEEQARLVQLDELGGRFFDPAGYSLLMFDEVQFPVHKDMRKESTTFWRYMKDLVTVEKIKVEIKGGAVYQVPNLASLLMAGNSGSHFPIEEYDRRIWVVDNNPPELAMGLVDRLFMLQKNVGLNMDERRKLFNTIRYHLSKHEIKLPLDKMRAPMTDAKRELYMASLSDIEEWWITHFEDRANLLAATPIISKSAVLYLIETSERLMNTKYREDSEGTFRDLRRRGLIRPIRTKGDQTQSRNMTNVTNVASNGALTTADRREVLYTTYNHGEFDSQDNNLVIQLYNDNIQKISNWKSNVIRPKAATTTAQDLIH